MSFRFEQDRFLIKLKAVDQGNLLTNVRCKGLCSMRRAEMDDSSDHDNIFRHEVRVGLEAASALHRETYGETYYISHLLGNCRDPLRDVSGF